MTFKLEYHTRVNRSGQRSIPAMLAVFGTLVLLCFFAASGMAQISGSASGSSHGVSSAPPTGSISPHTGPVAPPTSAINSGAGHFSNFPHSSGFPHKPGGHPHSRNSSDGAVYYPYLYGVAVPYADADDASADDDDAEYQGGPTVFDRRGSGAASYIQPSYEGPAHSQDQPSEGASLAQPSVDAPEEPQQSPTILVFKDGRQLEVENYAVVGQTLYDLTPGHRRKIALMDLDLSATEKQNDDRGVTFQLPSAPVS